MRWHLQTTQHKLVQPAERHNRGWCRVAGLGLQQQRRGRVGQEVSRTEALRQQLRQGVLRRRAAEADAQFVLHAERPVLGYDRPGGAQGLEQSGNTLASCRA